MPSSAAASAARCTIKGRMNAAGFCDANADGTHGRAQVLQANASPATVRPEPAVT